MRDQRAAQIDLALDLEAGSLERLRVDFGDENCSVKFFEPTRTCASAAVVVKAIAASAAMRRRVQRMGDSGKGLLD